MWTRYNIFIKWEGGGGGLGGGGKGGSSVWPPVMDEIGVCVFRKNFAIRPSSDLVIAYFAKENNCL